MAESAIAVEDLRIGYAHGRRAAVTDVVHRVSFEVHRGRTTALVGQSGSGKSTIAHGISGLLPANGAVTGGTIQLLGRDVTRWRPREWRELYGSSIGFVPQDPLSSLDPLVRVGSQIAQSLRVHIPARSPDRYAEDLSTVDPGAPGVLEIEGVTKVFGRSPADPDAVRAVDNVSLRLTRGSIHALVGESGSGKTTLARIAAGLTGFDTGLVTVNGRALDAPARRRRRRRDRRGT